MADFLNYCRRNLSLVAISVFWLIALLNPVFKKYDYGAEFPLVILFGVLILILVISEFKNKGERVFWEPFFLVAFFVSVAVSFYFSHAKNYGLSEVMAFSSMIPFYLVFAHKKNDWSEKFLKVVVVGLFLSVIIGFLFYFFYAEDRVFGPFFNILYHANKWPNAFALFMLMSWPVLLILHKGKFTALRIIGLAFVFGLFLLIYSRGALIVLGGQMLLLLIYFFKRIRIKTVVLFLVTAALSVGVFAVANRVREFQNPAVDISEKTNFANGESLTSVQERKDFMEGALKLIRQKPLTGWGPFSFRYAYNPIQKTFLGNSDHPHNVFLKIGAENGLIALVAFVLFLITVFITIAFRFSKLSRTRKDFVYLIFTAIAGAFAHNMIDYNLNFMANLVLLFILLIVARSAVVKKTTKERGPVFALIISIIIAGVAMYEGSVFVLSKTVDPAFMSYSIYPRDYYLSTAENDISKNNFEEALALLEHEKNLNSLDARADYLESVIYCDMDFRGFNVLVCKDKLSEAIALNPMNDFAYYRDYLKLLIPNILGPNDFKVVNEARILLTDYFGYVRANIHFTAYTGNVEAAYETAKFLIPHLDPKEASAIREESEKMLRTAKILRENKAF